MPRPTPTGSPATGSADGRPARVVVIDIDGVVADVRHRVHLVGGRRRDWDGFFAAAPRDPLLPEGAALVAAQVAEGNGVIWLSGRPERCRADTVAWLDRHGLPHDRLLLRADDDRRPGRLVKLRALERLRREGVVVVEVVDDDAAVVDLLRARGWPIRHATWMSDATRSVDEPPDAADVIHRVQQEPDSRT